MVITSGIDVGASAVKVAIIASPRGGGRARPGTEVLALVEERIRRRETIQVIRLAHQRALETAGLPEKAVEYVASTGEGELVEFRTGHFYGMTTHARGGIFLDREVRAVVDAGALHGRAIRFDAGAKVLDYRMTSQCASGSGQFLENIARYLGVTLEEVGALSESATRGERTSGICAVLAETDVINMVSRRVPLPEILRGIHDSIAGRFAKLLKSIKVEGAVLVTGGLCRDTGLLRALRDAVARDGIEIRQHPDGNFAGALGAALWGAYRLERLDTPLAARA